jgi:hypothetical protein
LPNCARPPRLPDPAACRAYPQLLPPAAPAPPPSAGHCRRRSGLALTQAMEITRHRFALPWVRVLAQGSAAAPPPQLRLRQTPPARPCGGGVRARRSSAAWRSLAAAVCFPGACKLWALLRLRAPPRTARLHTPASPRGPGAAAYVKFGDATFCQCLSRAHPSATLVCANGLNRPGLNLSGGGGLAPPASRPQSQGHESDAPHTHPWRRSAPMLVC